jgi:phospholipid transport system substrate-binding protein
MKTIQRTIVSLMIVLLSVVFTTPILATMGPTESIKPVLEDLTALLHNSGLQGDAHRNERRQKIMSTIKTGFDFQEMCKRVLGRTWQDISQDDRERFTEMMTKLLENAYIGKLEDYHYTKIEYTDEKIQDERAQVTTLIEKDAVKLPVNYILQLISGKWMVYDINIEGVSLVRNYNEQFKSILRTDKFEGLVKIIEEKNKTFEKTAKDS